MAKDPVNSLSVINGLGSIILNINKFSLAPLIHFSPLASA
jgi:hypothetical protein